METEDTSWGQRYPLDSDFFKLPIMNNQLIGLTQTELKHFDIETSLLSVFAMLQILRIFTIDISLEYILKDLASGKIDY